MNWKLIIAVVAAVTLSSVLAQLLMGEFDPLVVFIAAAVSFLAAVFIAFLTSKRSLTGN